MRYITLALVLAFAGCSNHKSADVVCYSGGSAIYKGTAHGNVSIHDGAARFTDEKGTYHKISGNCVVTYND